MPSMQTDAAGGDSRRTNTGSFWKGLYALSTTSLKQARRRWESVARADPMHSIATSRRDWTAESFYASGRAPVEEILAFSGPDLPRGRMLDIGCGLGRTARHFGRHFERVDGIDISPTMIEQATRHGLGPNVRLVAGSGRDLAPYEDEAFDLVFAYLVFQHVGRWETIESYLVEIARVLRPEGRAALQFDTRPPNRLIALYKTLPDPLLPRCHRRHLRRYRRRAGLVRERMGAAGLVILKERGAGTASHFFLLRRAGGEGERP